MLVVTQATSVGAVRRSAETPPARAVTDATRRHGGPTTGSGIPVGDPQASVYPPDSVWAPRSMYHLCSRYLRKTSGEGRPSQIVRTRAGLFRLATMSLTHYTIFTQVTSTTTNQQNTSPLNGNTSHATINLQTMTSARRLRSDRATHNPR